MNFASMLTCNNLDEWKSPEADIHQGLRVKRSIEPSHWQPVADKLYKKYGDRQKLLQERVVNLGEPKALLQKLFEEAARGVTCDLPSECAAIVYEDAVALASVSHDLVPDAQELSMKLELFGTNVCSRWHQDNFICRSIVSYNCDATEYTESSNVNFEELYHGGTNDQIIRDQSDIRSVNVGDLMMIKGIQFPGKAIGLVHKSPAVIYKERKGPKWWPLNSGTGDVQARLVLKVDI